MYVDYCLLRPAEARQWRPHKHSRLYYYRVIYSPGPSAARNICPRGLYACARMYSVRERSWRRDESRQYFRSNTVADIASESDWTTDTTDRSEEIKKNIFRITIHFYTFVFLDRMSSMVKELLDSNRILVWRNDSNDSLSYELNWIS